MREAKKIADKEEEIYRKKERIDHSKGISKEGKHYEGRGVCMCFSHGVSKHTPLHERRR